MEKLGSGLKKVLLAGIGAVAVTGEKSKELLDEMVKKGELTVEQGKALNEELKHNIKSTVKEKVNVKVKTSSPEELDELLDKMTPEQMALLKQRIDEMEKKQEEFEAAGNALRKVRPYKKKENMDSFPLYCTHCGRKLQRTFGLDDHFYCATPYWSEQETACKAARWDRTKLEEVLLEALKAQLSVREVEARKKKKDIEKDSTRLRTQLKLLNAELKQSDAQRIQSYMDFKAGTISREEFLAGRAERDSRQAELKANIAAVEAQYEDCIRAENDRKKEQATTSKAGSLDDEALKKVLYDAIEKVNITDGEHIEILWKFNDLFEAV